MAVLPGQMGRHGRRRALGAWLVLFGGAALARGEDFYSPDYFSIEEEEEEEADPDVEFPGGVPPERSQEPSLLRPPSPEVSPREPFVVKLFDANAQAWRLPKHQQEHAAQERKQFEGAWEWAANLDHAVDRDARDMTVSRAGRRAGEEGDEEEGPFQEASQELPSDLKRVRCGDLDGLVAKFANPTNEPITWEEEELLEKLVADLRRREGLLDDEKLVYLGFIGRGSPWQAIQKIRKELLHFRDTTGERELAAELAASRERPLLVRRAEAAREAERRERLLVEAEAAARDAQAVSEDREARMKRLAEKAAARLAQADAATQRPTKLRAQALEAAFEAQDMEAAALPTLPALPPSDPSSRSDLPGAPVPQDASPEPVAARPVEDFFKEEIGNTAAAPPEGALSAEPMAPAEVPAAEVPAAEPMAPAEDGKLDASATEPEAKAAADAEAKAEAAAREAIRAAFARAEAERATTGLAATEAAEREAGNEAAAAAQAQAQAARSAAAKAAAEEAATKVATKASAFAAERAATERAATETPPSVPPAAASGSAVGGNGGGGATTEAAAEAAAKRKAKAAKAAARLAAEAKA